jgi:hypothetical protein
LGKKLPVVENLMLFGKKTHLSSWEYYFLGGKKKDICGPVVERKSLGMKLGYLASISRHKIYGYPIF